MTCLDYALAYLNLGWSPVPIVTASKLPYIKWKKYQTVLPTENEIKAWWKRYPQAGVGIITGATSKIISIDFDGIDSIKRFIAQFGDRPTTLSFRSREGHEQDIYRYPSGYEISSTAKFLDDIHIRANGGLFVAPPTLHKSGSQYQWIKINPVEDGLDDLLDLPDEILNFILSMQGGRAEKSNEKIDDSMRSGSNFPSWLEEIIGGVAEGNRTNSATRIAGYFLREYAGDRTKALLMLRGWNVKNRPPLLDNELQKIIDNISLRQDKDEFKKHYGFDIEETIFHKAPRGDGSYYEFKIAGQEDTIKMTSADLLTSQKFRAKYSDITGKIIPMVKNAVYNNLIEKMINEAKQKLVITEATRDGYIAELIKHNVKTSTDDLSYINQMMVVKDNTIFLKIAGLRALMGHDANTISRQDLAHILRNLGFAYKTVRINTEEVEKVWSISFDGLKKFFERDILEEIGNIFNE